MLGCQWSQTSPSHCCSKLESTLAVVHARGGSDAEDVTGALKVRQLCQRQHGGSNSCGGSYHGRASPASLLSEAACPTYRSHSPLAVSP